MRYLKCGARDPNIWNCTDPPTGKMLERKWGARGPKHPENKTKIHDTTETKNLVIV